MLKLTNNKILVTGGASGIGLALTIKLTEMGNEVIIVGRNESKLKVAALNHKNISYYVCDLSKEAELDGLLVKLENEHPDVNILINNAAIQHNYSLTENPISPAELTQEIRTNYLAPVKLATALIPNMLNQENCAIVNITSALALTPKEDAPVYCSTKAALRSFTTGLRYQLENTNIKVIELVPPLVETEMTKGRGTDKVTPEYVVESFINKLKSGRNEIVIGKANLIKFIHRVLPGLAAKIMRKS